MVAGVGGEPVANGSPDLIVNQRRMLPREELALVRNLPGVDRVCEQVVDVPARKQYAAALQPKTNWARHRANGHRCASGGKPGRCPPRRWPVGYDGCKDESCDAGLGIAAIDAAIKGETSHGTLRTENLHAPCRQDG